MAHHNPKVKLEKAPVVEPVKWDPDDHPHAIWCSSYGPDEAMQSTNSLSYIDPKTQAERFDLTLAGSEEGPATGEEEVPSEIASIGQAGCAYTASSLASDQLLLRCCVAALLRLLRLLLLPVRRCRTKPRGAATAGLWHGSETLHRALCSQSPQQQIHHRNAIGAADGAGRILHQGRRRLRRRGTLIPCLMPSREPASEMVHASALDMTRRDVILV
jgi:hypothetical protein